MYIYLDVRTQFDSTERQAGSQLLRVALVPPVGGQQQQCMTAL